MKKKLILALTIVSLCINSIGCSKTTTNDNTNSVIESTENIENINNEDVALDEELGDVTASITLGDIININGNGATVTDNKVTINNRGTYVISGTSSNSQIIIDSASEENVYLVLNNVNLTYENSAPIYVQAAKNAILVLPDGTTNTITDGDSYTFEDSTTDEPNATIFSKDYLTIRGNGTLTVNANYNNGITSKDDLKITGGNITITSADDGLMGKDSITIKGGNITINASGDGLKSTNTEDTSKGYVLIEGGTLNITSTNDGIQAETNVNITDGTINIVADPEDIYEKNKNNEAGRDRKKHLYANVVLRHNTKDPVTLVHEFLHTINNEPDNRISRKYITEAISIYFESDMCEFLKRKGFTEKELMINDIFRHADLSGCVDDLMPIFPLLDSFRLLGPINSDSYDRMQQLSIEPLAMSKEEFYSKTSNFEERLARVRKRNELLHITDGPKTQEPLVTFGYVIGTLIAYYGIENGTDDIHQRMIHLNNIVNKATFSDLLSYIDIDITNEKELLKKIVPPLNKKIQKIKAYSSGEKNEPKEK